MNPIASGCFIWVKIILVKILIKETINWIISENSLFKILILGINDKELSFFLKF